MICIDTELSKFFRCGCEFNGFEIIKRDNGVLDLKWTILSGEDISKYTYQGVVWSKSEPCGDCYCFNKHQNVKTAYIISFYTLYKCPLNPVIGEFLSNKEYVKESK